MNKTLLTLVCLLSLTGCVTHKISTTNEIAWLNADPQPQIIQLNTRPEGYQCFEPMLYVLSLGIIPTHCVNTFEVRSSTEPGQQTKVRVTTIGGWAALFLAPLPKWKFGEAPEKYRFKFSDSEQSMERNQ